MKKLLFLATLFCATLTLSAQNVTESIISFGKGQISGYLIDVPNADVKTAEAAFRDLMEQKYNLKASKENGFRAYLIQSGQFFFMLLNRFLLLADFGL